MSFFNRLIVASLPLVPKPVVAYFSKPYIAGEQLLDAVATVKGLNGQSAMATIDVLGEDVFTKEESVAARDQVKQVLNAITQHTLDANISIKLTQLGLKIGKDFCFSNVQEIIKTAREQNRFIRIDMEDHACTGDTLEVYRMARAEYPNVGIVIQAYLNRSEDDVKRLAAEGANVRLCKGIYNEPAAIAIKDRREIRQNFIRLLKILLNAKCYVGIATHDEILIAGANQLVKDLQVKAAEYEFQMLLGVREQKRKELIAAGSRLRVYTPFGEQWYGYSTRRLKENPQMAGHIVKAIFGFNS